MTRKRTCSLAWLALRETIVRALGEYGGTAGAWAAVLADVGLERERAQLSEAIALDTCTRALQPLSPRQQARVLMHVRGELPRDNRASN